MSLPPLPLPDDRTKTAKDGQFDYWYLSDSMLAYGRACRAAALEEAAKMCDLEQESGSDPKACANIIRALKEKP